MKQLAAYVALTEIAVALVSAIALTVGMALPPFHPLGLFCLVVAAFSALVISVACLAVLYFTVLEWLDKALAQEN